MKKEDIKYSLDKIEPNDIQRKRMFNNIIDSSEINNKGENSKRKWYAGKGLYTKVACIVSLALIFALSFQPINNLYISRNANNDSDVKVTKNYNELYDLLSNLSYDDGVIREDMLGAEENMVNGNDSMAPSSPSKDISESNNSSDKSNPDYSDTNLQVAGVQEADIVKTDGKYIYAVSNDCLYIVSVENGKLKLISKLKGTESGIYNNYYTDLFEMYVTENRLIVLKYFYEDIKTDKEEKMYDTDMAPDIAYYKEQTGVGIEIYDISDRTDPKLLNTLGQSGYYVSSRMIGDTLYLVSNKYVYNIQKGKPETFVPQIYRNDKKELISFDDIYVNKNTNSSEYLIISGIDTRGDGEIVSTKSLLGYGRNIYASLNNLYVTSYTQINDGNKYTSATKLFRFSLDKGKVELEAEGSVPGDVLNQFSMDEYDGFFRIVTTVNSYTEIIDKYNSSIGDLKQYNCLHTLNDKLEIIGKIENLAPDERIYSARFEGDIVYFVTFRQVDPLFTVDLSDPSKPKILSELKIPGFSEYLHKYTDGLLFGLGKEADEKTGRAGYMKLSMFDTSDPNNVIEKHKLVIDGKHYSEASYNHKAILIDSKKNIIAFPCEDEYMVYSYDEETGFKKEAAIKMTTSVDGYYYGYYGNMRGLFIGDYLYVVTLNNISSYNMSDYAFSENVKLH